MTTKNGNMIKVRSVADVLDSMEITHEFTAAGCLTTYDADGGAFLKFPLWPRVANKTSHQCDIIEGTYTMSMASGLIDFLIAVGKSSLTRLIKWN